MNIEMDSEMASSYEERGAKHSTPIHRDATRAQLTYGSHGEREANRQPAECRTPGCVQSPPRIRMLIGRIGARMPLTRLMLVLEKGKGNIVLGVGSMSE